MDSAPHLENHAAHIERHLSAAAAAVTLDPVRAPELDGELELELEQAPDDDQAA